MSSFHPLRTFPTGATVGAETSADAAFRELEGGSDARPEQRCSPLFDAMRRNVCFPIVDVSRRHLTRPASCVSRVGIVPESIRPSDVSVGDRRYQATYVGFNWMERRRTK